jgi:hypothetical protein
MQPIIIKNRNVRIERTAAKCDSEKSVQLLEDRGAVRAIEIRCACGDTTIIELDYDSPAPAQTEIQ